jgi:hypothetical protein
MKSHILGVTKHKVEMEKLFSGDWYSSVLRSTKSLYQVYCKENGQQLTQTTRRLLREHIEAFSSAMLSTQGVKGQPDVMYTDF